MDRINTKPEPLASELVPDLLTPRAAAAKLGVSVSGLNHLGIPRVRLGYRTVRYAPADVLVVLAQRKAVTT